ncbi:hypothetical protein MKW98_000917 [Papaver atlanticum]|uniref:PGG domain-containing protein n=1 Tax=Papaver atlanticum TaxID=357466 RepID=A0AAD4SEF0_9MAGN|nr:hypothetical protein MKW98_000917 [Papaver atlanticum]
MFKDSRLDNLDESSTGFRTPLHIAVIPGDKRLARDILSLGPDLALKEDRRGWTTLHLASARASLKMVKLLLNAEPNACMVKDKDERRPLHLAAMNNRINIMEVSWHSFFSFYYILCLFQKKKNIMENNQNGETILHFCVRSKCSMEALELLVDKLALERISDPDIIINSKDYNGKTVLQLAAEMGNTEMVQYLLESSNLKLEITDADFDKALDALTPENKIDLETRFLKYIGHDNKKHKSNTSSKNGDKHERLKETVNALMVVATLIAGIAFQAAMNPPGCVCVCVFGKTILKLILVLILLLLLIILIICLTL